VLKLKQKRKREKIMLTPVIYINHILCCPYNDREFRGFVKKASAKELAHYYNETYRTEDPKKLRMVTKALCKKARAQRRAVGA
jgi:hypothetical protein